MRQNEIMCGLSASTPSWPPGTQPPPLGVPSTPGPQAALMSSQLMLLSGPFIAPFGGNKIWGSPSALCFPSHFIFLFFSFFFLTLPSPERAENSSLSSVWAPEVQPPSPFHFSYPGLFVQSVIRPFTHSLCTRTDAGGCARHWGWGAMVNGRDIAASVMEPPFSAITSSIQLNLY